MNYSDIIIFLFVVRPMAKKYGKSPVLKYLPGRKLFIFQKEDMGEEETPHGCASTCSFVCTCG